MFKSVPGCIEGIPGHYGMLRAIMGCSRGVPGLFRAVPVAFRGCSGVFRGCSGVFRVCSGCVPGFTDTHKRVVHSSLDIQLISHAKMTTKDAVEEIKYPLLLTVSQ